MRASEILRGLADIIDKASSGNEQGQLTSVSGVEKSESDQQPVMVPPLQAKLEILKKSEGLPNVYDNKDSNESEQGEDELSSIKKNAGLTAAQQESSEDNDITG